MLIHSTYKWNYLKNSERSIKTISHVVESSTGFGLPTVCSEPVNHLDTKLDHPVDNSVVATSQSTQHYRISFLALDIVLAPYSNNRRITDSQPPDRAMPRISSPLISFYSSKAPFSSRTEDKRCDHVRNSQQ